MESAGDGLMDILWKLEKDIKEFNSGLDIVDQKH